MNISPQFGRIFKIHSVLIKDNRLMGDLNKLNQQDQLEESNQWAHNTSAPLRAHSAVVKAIAETSQVKLSEITSYQLSYEGDTYMVVSTEKGPDTDEASKTIVNALHPNSKNADFKGAPGQRFYCQELPEVVADTLNVVKNTCGTVLSGYVIPDDQEGIDPTVKVIRTAMLPPGMNRPKKSMNMADWFLSLRPLQDYFELKLSEK